jgi:uncharacterized protein involved in type VI secretion and phage assembly
MTHENDAGDVRFYAMYVGEVVDRSDPEGLGRVRVRIPGLVEDAGPWAWPLGSPGGGIKQRGLKMVPRLHAEVAVFFHGGNPDVPYYMPAQWGTGEMLTDPAAVPTAEMPDVDSLETERYAITIDNRPGHETLRLKDKSTGDMIEMDGTSATGPGITIQGSAAILLKSSGAVVIDATSVVIMGRKVTDGSQNI